MPHIVYCEFNVVYRTSIFPVSIQITDNASKPQPKSLSQIIGVVLDDVYLIYLFQELIFEQSSVDLKKEA